MSLFIFRLAASLLATLAVAAIGTPAREDLGGRRLAPPPKFHAAAVPRIGGIGVITGNPPGSLLAGAQVRSILDFWILLACAIPAFVAGIAEDLTKRVAARWRVLASGGFRRPLTASWALNAVLVDNRTSPELTS